MDTKVVLYARVGLAVTSTSEWTSIHKVNLIRNTPSHELWMSPERNMYTTGVVCKENRKDARTPSVLLVQDESVYIDVRVFLYRVNVL